MAPTLRPAVHAVALTVGLEIHVELATRSKMFSRAPSPATPRHYRAQPNSLTDPTVLALPGALPVMNRAAVELAMTVGLALGCEVPVGRPSRWDRKSYFYPDLPKGYQISQYLHPICQAGLFTLPPIGQGGRIDWDAAGRGEPGPAIRILRAHLEEDAGKLLHEAPVGGGGIGGGPIDGSIVDLNRAGTPLLEIVTAPDFTSADQAVVFAQALRDICRFVGATEGVMQRGHMRFEPNINTILTLDDGSTVATPIVEIKNLNSFKALRAAIEHESAEQPRRWAEDGRAFAPGTKTTRGWDDDRATTFVQREKEEAHDYRYFPDPDLVPVVVDEAWRARVAAAVPELPLARARRYIRELGLSPKEAAALVEERAVCAYYEAAVAATEARGIPRDRAGRAAANLILQSGAKRTNEFNARAPDSAGAEPALVSDSGVEPATVGAIAALREEGRISAGSADELFGLYCSLMRTGEPAEGFAASKDAEELARERGMLIVRDDAAIDRWCRDAIDANPKVADDVRAGKTQAVGRLVGAAMKNASAAGTAADASSIRARLLEILAVSE